MEETPADVACPTEVVAIALHEVVGGEESPIIQLRSNRVAQVSVTTAANVRHCHLRAIGELRQRIAIHMRMFEPWRREHPCRDGFPRPSAVPRAEGKTFLGGLPVVTRPTDHRAGEVNRRVRTGEIDLFPGHALSVGLPQAGAMRLQGAVVIPHHYIVFALTGMPVVLVLAIAEFDMVDIREFWCNAVHRGWPFSLVVRRRLHPTIRHPASICLPRSESLSNSA